MTPDNCYLVDKKERRKESCGCKGAELQVVCPVFGKARKVGTNASALENTPLPQGGLNFVLKRKHLTTGYYVPAKHNLWGAFLMLIFQRITSGSTVSWCPNHWLRRWYILDGKSIYIQIDDQFILLTSNSYQQIYITKWDANKTWISKHLSLWD